MQTTSGKSSLTGSVIAFSSAIWRRLSRISRDWISKVFEMGTPRRSAWVSARTRTSMGHPPPPSASSGPPEPGIAQRDQPDAMAPGDRLGVASGTARRTHRHQFVITRGEPQRPMSSFINCARRWLRPQGPAVIDSQLNSHGETPARQVFWWARRGSNPGPLPCHGSALTN
jgi:hypothetical protein